MKYPTVHHPHILKYTLRYLKATPHHGLLFPSTTDVARLTKFSDGDYSKSPDFKSTSSAADYIYITLVPWQSKKSEIVALSTCEEEYITGSCAVQQPLWLIWLLDDISATPSNTYATRASSSIKPLAKTVEQIS